MSRQVFQCWLPFMLAIAAIFVGLGRSFVGLGGWGLLATLVMYMPILLVYAVVVGVILRRRPAGYLMSVKVQRVFIALLVSLFLLSIFMVDGGDTPESVGSLFTGLLSKVGIANGIHDSMISLSSIVGFISYYAAMIFLGVSFGLLMNDHRDTTGKLKN